MATSHLIAAAVTDWLLFHQDSYKRLHPNDHSLSTELQTSSLYHHIRITAPDDYNLLVYNNRFSLSIIY